MKKSLVFIMVCVLCFLSSCSADPEETTSSITAGSVKISAEVAFNMMNDGDTYVLLDVRTSEEYKEERIDGAVLIPDTEIQVRAAQELSDKGARILIYCRSGRRSASAANELLDMGYTNIFDFGGIIDWPYDTVSD